MAAANPPPASDAAGRMSGDYRYILDIIQYLEERWRIFLFISTRDFDVLYRWWEKQIPLQVVREAIDRVIRRRSKKGKKIDGFANFNYEVKKNFQAFMQLNVQLVDDQDSTSSYAELDHFIEAFPSPLKNLRDLFVEIVTQIKKGTEVDLDLWRSSLLEQFAHDEDLEIKVKVFLRNLAPELRNEEIATQYRLNYLSNHFGIPDLEIYNGE
jgi:hypothetical protein